MVGRNSIFDTTTWLKFPPPKDIDENIPGIGEAWQTVMKTTVRIARLARLTRHARRFPDNSNVRLEATRLAHELFNLNLDSWIQTLKETRTLTTTTAREFQDMSPNCFVFSSTRLLILLVQYWEMRVLVCGCYQHLLRLSPAPATSSSSSSLDKVGRSSQHHKVGQVEKTELQAAMRLIMALEELHETATHGRCRAVELRCIFPVQMIFAALYRCENRGVLDIDVTMAAMVGGEGGGDGDDIGEGRGAGHVGQKIQAVKKSRHLQIQCIGVQNRWTKGFHPYGLSMELMRTIAEIYSGGPIPVGMRAQHVSGETEPCDDDGDHDADG